MEIDFEWIENHIFHRHLNAEEKQALDKSILTVEFNKNDVLIAEGERCDGLYLFYSGRAGVYHDSHGEKVRVGEVTAGAQLGDMAIFDDEPYSTTITALSECVAYKISSQDMNSLMAYHHEMAKDIMINTIRRLAGIVRGMNSANAYSQQYIRGRRS